jgi:hypothetical protein
VCLADILSPRGFWNPDYYGVVSRNQNKRQNLTHRPCGSLSMRANIEKLAFIYTMSCCDESIHLIIEAAQGFLLLPFHPLKKPFGDLCLNYCLALFQATLKYGNASIPIRFVLPLTSRKQVP